MRLEEIVVLPRLVRAFGPRASLEISAPAPGTLRLRALPRSAEATLEHPELPKKESFAVVPGPVLGGLALVAKREGDRLLVSAEGAELSLSLAGGGFSFRDGAGRELARGEEISGDFRAAYPFPQCASRLALASPEGEAYVGFGEKVGPLDKRGMRLVFWNTDVMPHHPDTDPLYVSIPFFVALGRGPAWGLFLDEPARSEVDVALADPSRIVWEARSRELDFYLFAGPEPADVVSRYARLTGLPFMPPLWSLGAAQSRWGYESEGDVRAVVRGYRSRGLPLDSVYLDIDHQEGYRPLTWDRARFPDPRGLAADLAEDGVRLVTIVDPALPADPSFPPYAEARAKDLLVRTDRGEVLLGEVWAKPSAYPDFSRAEVRRFWADLCAPHVEAGVSGLWNDMNEPSCFSVEPGAGRLSPHAVPLAERLDPEGPTLPADARHGARRHLEVHNVYGLGMAEAAFEGLRRAAPDRRPFVLTRAGYAGVQRHAAVWTGDNSSHWSHLELSLAMLAGLGVSGVPFCGADVPGFLGRPSAELFVRWMQAGTFYPLLRNHSAKGTPSKEPWRFGDRALSLAKEALLRRYRLLPTLYTLMREAAETGLPPLRPLALHFPGEPECLGASDELLFGEHLLIAPVVRPATSRRLVYLPAGRWLAWPSLGEPGALADGSRHVVAEAPLEVVPTWLREGGAVALTSPALSTRSANFGALAWHVHVAEDGRAHGRVFEDEGDGAGPCRDTRLEGRRQGGAFVLARRAEGALPLARSVESLFLAGLPPPREVRGARSHAPSPWGLELELDAAWAELELRF